MQSKWPLFVVSIVGIVCAAIIIFSTSIVRRPISQTVIDSTSVESLQGSASSTQLSLGIPIRLLIPKIHVDALIEDVATTSDGAMAVPVGPIDVAWFDLGPRPGEIGSSVIAGHEGWKDGIAAVFDNLHQLQKGDEISVEDASGTTATFVVVKTQLYDQDGNVADVFTSGDGLAHLNLITCEGTWNPIEKSYSNRLVVFADEISATSSPQK